MCRTDNVPKRLHDTTALLAGAGERLPVLVDQGDADNFLAEQLRTPLLEQACRTESEGHVGKLPVMAVGNRRSS